MYSYKSSFIESWECTTKVLCQSSEVLENGAFKNTWSHLLFQTGKISLCFTQLYHGSWKFRFLWQLLLYFALDQFISITVKKCAHGETSNKLDLQHSGTGTILYFYIKAFFFWNKSVQSLTTFFQFIVVEIVYKYSYLYKSVCLFSSQSKLHPEF